MAKALKSLGFSIFRQRNGELFRNLTLDQIRKTIDEFVSKDFTEFDCSLVYVTTHGNYPDRLAAFDMMYDSESVIEPFYAADQFLGKPKFSSLMRAEGLKKIRVKL